jgi:uncharacterized protein (TIGR03086 family)
VIPALPPSVEQSVELLERALAYTRGRLARVTPDLLRRPTPCTAWDLQRLLEHMDDSLDAFLEAAGGVVALRSRPADPSATATVGRLQMKACTLVGVWTGSVRGGAQTVEIGGRRMPTGLLVGTAALEVTVHGWDVGRATGEAAPLPAELARALRPIAAFSVTAADRGVRFADPVPVAPDAAPDQVLLAYLGRSDGPYGQISPVPRTGT